ncbi:MAG: DUF512 domain-containing protein [Nitrospirae bacterium]|nr:MAG: DUF512 domain-containing protein [Nitrospirota bacterium]
MTNKSGICIEHVMEGGPAGKAGLKSGDIITSINGHPAHDSIDLMFYSGEPEMRLRILRDGAKQDFRIALEEGAANPGIVLKQFPVKTCKNNCIFCFVSQLPRGLRRPLYVKDEDYRMSFLYGNYITLTNLSDADKARIISQRLSPLYISVHSTDDAIRRRMLANPKAADIMAELKFFARHRIKMHVQIVLCPGYNDGRELEKTIRDLSKLFPHIMSIAVVPVGLTLHRRKPLQPVGKEDALSALDIIRGFQEKFLSKHGERLVFGADELYIKAGGRFPSLEEYEELYQIENGVGLVPQFTNEAKRLRLSGIRTTKRFATFTGTSFYPYLERLIGRIKKTGIDIELRAVENKFFGSSVTVTGLLTGKDIIRTFSDRAGKFDILLIPDVVLREGDNILLDNVTLKDLESGLGVKTAVIDSTPRGLVNALKEFQK